MDFIVKLPPKPFKEQVYDSILVVVNRYTKIAKYFPVWERSKAPELANLVVMKNYLGQSAPVASQATQVAGKKM